MDVSLFSVWIEAIAYFEHEHNEPLQTDVATKALSQLSELDKKVIWTEKDRNTAIMILEIFDLYGETGYLNREWTTKTQCLINKITKH